jgi:polar amino acid transport system substrate-binding protein
MKFRVVVALVCLLAALVLAACGDDEDTDGSGSGSGSGSSEQTDLKLKAPTGLVADGKFTACMDISFPPLEYTEGGSSTPKGFDVEVIRAVADAWGVEPVYKNTQFDGLLPALSSGRCDVAWSAMFVNPERTKTFPAIPYYKTGTVLLVQEGNPSDISSPEDLSGKVVAAQNGTLLLEGAKKLAKEMAAEGKTPPDVQGYPKATDLIQQLVVGRADAAVTQDTEAGYRAKQNPGQFEVAYQYPDKETFGVYHRKDATELAAALEEALRALDENGTLRKIAEQEGVPPGGLAVE